MSSAGTVSLFQPPMPPKRKPAASSSSSSATTTVSSSSSGANKRPASDEDTISKRPAVVDLTGDAPAVAPLAPAPVPVPPSTEFVGKSIFLMKLCRSFTFDELWAADAATRSVVVIDEADFRRKVEVVFRSGERMSVSTGYFVPIYAEYRLAGKLPAWTNGTLIDWAHTSGQTDCPLTTEAFKKPHILSCNGRSYSLDAFNEAVKKTLQQGEPLRLEDMTLTALDLGTMQLYPNYSLPGWELLPAMISFDEASVDARKLWFYEDRCGARHDAAIAALFDQNPSYEYTPESVTAMHIVDAYRAKYNTRGRVVEDLVVASAVFPRAHIKSGPHLRNVLFRDCIILFDCLCGVRFVGCRFERCVFLVTGSASAYNNLFCEFNSCRFVFLKSSQSVPADDARKTAQAVEILDKLGPRVVHDCQFVYVDPAAFPLNYVFNAPHAGLKARVLEATEHMYLRRIPNK